MNFLANWPLNLRYKSQISSHSQRLTEIDFAAQLQTLYEISHGENTFRELNW